MPSRPSTRLAALGVALLAAGGLLGLAAPADAAARPAVSSTAHHRTTVLLPTGDAVSVDPARPKDVRVRTRSASGLGHAWRSFTAKGHTYVVPLVAAPFLGTVLDPTLFDVTALAKAGKRMPVSVTVTRGAKASVPGLTVKKRSKTAQTGYFTAAGAKRFGAALQRAAINSRARASATRSLFGASTIRIAGAGGVVKPLFAQQTVIFHVTGADGKPLPQGFLFYGNLDDAARATNFAVVIDGEVRVSLPAGNYTLYGEALTITSDTTADFRIVTQPALRITGQKNQTVDVDFRTATAQPTLTLPQPTNPKDYLVGYDREWPTGGFSGFVFGDSSLTTRVAPAPAPQIGTASLTTFFRVTPTSGASEEYDAGFVQQGAITADQSHVLAAGQLADVQERIADTGSPNPAAFGHGLQLPDGSGFGFADRVALPFTRLDHLYAPAGAFWADQVITASTDLDPFAGQVSDGLRSYAAGTSSTAEWLRQAVAPAVPTFTDADLAAGTSCPACRTATRLTVQTVPLQDSFGSGHYGFLFDEETGQQAARTRLYRDGRIVDDEPGSNGVVATVPAGAADYRMVADSTPASAGFAFGTVARTEWTFRSSSSTGAALPAGVGCSVDGTGTCRVLPLLRVVAPLPSGLDGRMSVGRHDFPLCVTPIQGASAGTVSATAQVSFDGGRTFQDVPLAATGAGCFTAALTNPAGSAGTSALVRITGTADGGSTVVQTVRDAYRVSAS